MCGIAGFVSNNLSVDNLHALTRIIAHRGPDAEGHYIEKPFGLGHRRLSIIDLSAVSNQPLISRDGKWVIIFNGEIYNYKELRGQLEANGCQFQTESDTEVVLETFARKGLEGINDFIGMFAFAILHRPSQKLYLFRDRIGVKPLFYSCNERDFFFASEVKAIQPLLTSKELDKESLADFFRLGYSTGRKTIYKNIRKVLPGHYLEVNADGKVEEIRYWELKPHSEKLLFKTEEQAAEALEELLTEAFNYRMVADVPVGVFLSGGIDSSIVTALLAKSNRNLKTFTIGFDDPRYDESGYAAEIAKILGTVHHEKILSAKDASKVMDQYFEIYDEPFADSSGIPVYLISQFAKEVGCKVVLSADGGDELFCGYPRYGRIRRTYAAFNSFSILSGLIRLPLKLLSNSNFQYKNIEHKARRLLDLMLASKKFSAETYLKNISVTSDTLLSELLNYGECKTELIEMSSTLLVPEEKMMLWDILNYMPNDLLVKVDRASMANSIEAREPFLDHRLVEFAFALPLKWRRNKSLLRKILNDFVPESYFNRPKMGFSIPLFRWFSENLDADFDRLFTKSSVERTGVLNYEIVRKEYIKYKDFKSNGKEFNMLFIWHLYVFLKWSEKWV